MIPQGIRGQLQGLKDKKYLSLSKSCLATNYVAATFHQTIGQCAHQSLRNTATPELGMIPQGIRVNVGLHIAKVFQSAKQHITKIH